MLTSEGKIRYWLSRNETYLLSCTKKKKSEQRENKDGQNSRQKRSIKNYVPDDEMNVDDDDVFPQMMTFCFYTKKSIRNQSSS